MGKEGGLRPELRLLVCVSGIYFFYMFYGVLQEKIYKTDPTGDRFDNTLFLLAVQCFVNMLVALVGNIFFGSNKFGRSFNDPATKSPLLSVVNHSGYGWLAFISLTYLSAMFASNQALSYVNYPTQVLGKSCKMIPVMLANVLIGGTKYSVKEYACVFAITLGIVLFNFGKSSSKAAGENSAFGLFLLFASLAGDGITSSNQKLFRDEFSPSTHSLMFQMNMWSCVYLVPMLALTGEGMRGLLYCVEHPELMQSIIAFAICSALGQNFIFYTITGPGPLACTTITTTRKFFTILVSVLLYPENMLTPMQWGGVTLVFAGLIGELHDKYVKHQNKSTSKLGKMT